MWLKDKEITYQRNNSGKFPRDVSGLKGYHRYCIRLPLKEVSPPINSSIQRRLNESISDKDNVERIFSRKTDQTTPKTFPNSVGLPWWLSSRELDCQYRISPWVGKIPWRRKWQPTPVFLSGKFHAQRRLVDYNPWGHKESNSTY